MYVCTTEPKQALYGMSSKIKGNPTKGSGSGDWATLKLRLLNKRKEKSKKAKQQMFTAVLHHLEERVKTNTWMSVRSTWLT